MAVKPMRPIDEVRQALHLQQTAIDSLKAQVTAINSVIEDPINRITRRGSFEYKSPLALEIDQRTTQLFSLVDALKNIAFVLTDRGQE